MTQRLSTIDLRNERGDESDRDGSASHTILGLNALEHVREIPRRHRGARRRSVHSSGG